MDIKIPDGLAKATEKLAEPIGKVVEGLTLPAARGIGNTLGDLWFLVFGGVSQAADKRRIKYQHGLEAFRDSLEEKIEAIPNEKFSEPNTQIVTQALENAKYCVEEPELREMFARLIASTCNLDMINSIHPSFATIIKQLSPLEANLLCFHKDFRRPVMLTAYNAFNNSPRIRVITLASALEQFKPYPLELLSSCYDHFEGLGLMKIYENDPFVIDPSTEITDSTLRVLEKNYLQLEKKLGKKASRKLARGRIITTDFGENFLSSCVTSPNESWKKNWPDWYSYYFREENSDRVMLDTGDPKLYYEEDFDEALTVVRGDTEFLEWLFSLKKGEDYEIPESLEKTWDIFSRFVGDEEFYNKLMKALKEGSKDKP